MKRKFALAVFVSVFAGWSGTAFGQGPAVRPAAAREANKPGYNLTYCAGLISEHRLQEGLRVATGEEADTRTQFVVGDLVYLNLGAGWIVNPGGHYMVLRPVEDLIRSEAFPRQFERLRALGIMYKEVGRIKVNVVRAQSATATVLHNCEPIQPGDVCIPFDLKDEPTLQLNRRLDPLAPPTGKISGTIIAGKGYAWTLGQRDVAFLDIGGKQGVAIGQYYRVYRPFDAKNDIFHKPATEYPPNLASEQMSPRLTPQQQAGLPRQIVGEMVIIHVEGKAATALITSVRRPIQVGDYVELQ